MKKIDITPEEAELMNYNDIAHLILETNKKKMKLKDLFDEVSNTLGLNSDDYASHIADFFELLSTDKRFIMLDGGYWDLKIKHNKGMEAFEDEDDDIILESDEMPEDNDIYDEEEKGEDDDVSDDDLSDLVIVDDLEDDSNL